MGQFHNGLGLRKIFAETPLRTEILLWQVVGNEQLRAKSDSHVAAVEPQIVRAQIIIIVQIEAQAELGCPAAVDE